MFAGKRELNELREANAKLKEEVATLAQTEKLAALAGIRITDAVGALTTLFKKLDERLTLMEKAHGIEVAPDGTRKPELSVVVVPPGGDISEIKDQLAAQGIEADKVKIVHSMEEAQAFIAEKGLYVYDAKVLRSENPEKNDSI